MKQMDAESILLDEVDIDHIARVVQTEVGANWQGDILKTGVAAIVDTILNRVAYYGPYPDSVTGVANQKNAFTKINGPKSYYNSKLKRRVQLNPYGSVQKAPKASAEIDRLVRETIAERASGGESIVGPSLHYANPHPAYSGDNGRGPDGWVWQIAQDPYLVTGTGKHHSHVHGTDPNMRPLKSAPAVKFESSKENAKPSIDDLHHVFSTPDGLDMVAPPIPAKKGERRPMNPRRAELLDRIERKPLSFKAYYDRIEAELDAESERASGLKHEAGSSDLDIYEVGLLDLHKKSELHQDKKGAAATGAQRGKTSQSRPGGRSSRQETADEDVFGIPVPRPKPDQHSSAAPAGSNPFNLGDQHLETQAWLIENNPMRAYQLIKAAGRDPRLFGFV